MAPRPDWGHGPNPPVPVFTEAEVRAVLTAHPPEAHWCNDGTAALYCGCTVFLDWTSEHFIEKLKEAHG